MINYIYINVTQIPLLFAYKNVTQSSFFCVLTPPPPPSSSSNFKNSMRNCVTQSVRIFVYKNLMQIVLFFAKCLVFLYRYLYYVEFSPLGVIFSPSSGFNPCWFIYAAILFYILLFSYVLFPVTSFYLLQVVLHMLPHFLDVCPHFCMSQSIFNAIL